MGSREATTSRIGSKPGFTLIEVVLIATIISILLAASLPRFQQTAQRLRVEQSAFALAQLLRFAHELSVTDEAEVVWAWRSEERLGRVWERGEDDAPWRDRSPSSRATLAEGVALDIEALQPPAGCPEPVAASACVHFFPDGTSEPTTFTLRLDTHTYQVRLDGTTSDARLLAGSAAR